MSTEQLQPLTPGSAQTFLDSLQASLHAPQQSYSFSDLVSPGQGPVAAGLAAPAAGRRQAAAAKDDHKRKNEFRERDPVDDVSSDDDSHDDKKKAAKGGRRKSNAQGDGKDPVKLNKRKEQNRAAQKAFRERREARVKDLEAKVAELENKQFGVTVENENLRELLARLQQENVALKQSAFTFSVPAPNQNKPISPPTTEGSLASVQDSPASVDSTPQTFHADPFNAFIAGQQQRPAPPTFAHRQSSESSLAWSLDGQSQNQADADVQALFQSFYPANPANKESQPFPEPDKLASGINPTPFTLLNTAPHAVSYRDLAGPNKDEILPMPSFSGYREPTFPDANDEAMMDDFLASLVPPPDADPFGMIPDIEPGASDLYNQLLQSYTPTSSVPSSQSAFSPSQFLNNSPSSSATAPSPATSGTGSERQSSLLTKAQIETPLQTFGNVKPEDEQIHVISKDGRIWKPLELWESVRKEFTSSEDLVIDDLCADMKAKATCSNGKAVIDEECVRQYFKFQADRHAGR